MRNIILSVILLVLTFEISAQNVDLNNSTDYIRVQKVGESGFSRAFGLNGSNQLYIGSVEKTIGNIHFFNKGTNHLMTIRPNGYVGIGTVNPSYRLDVYGTSEGIKLGDSEGTLLFRNNTGGANEIRSYGLNLKIETRDTQDIFFNSNNGTSRLMTIKGDGSGVGIGTITPDFALDVYGTSEGIKLGGTEGTLLFRNNTGGANEIRSYNLNLEIETRDSQDISFNSNNGNLKLVTIKGDGSGVGIGTTNPGAWKLAVNGKIRAKEIKVETGWSDFVFYDDYKLPTLKEVEDHIKIKGHLQDIPSAKEVKEKGIFLGEMDAKLLQKIEELTLYTINQEKRINELEAENENVGKENEELKILANKFLELQERLEKLESRK
ncbi:hypothetical protein AWE51_07535 [Aquimarina aggregata]|uniref:BZIP transcription factor n=1 Tax=Aquimarina aggregata TaxID=1642818 RepID=A0A162CQU7_9FLAO|nr:hypothetical protein [Aquimarina aggregata]KZS40794.1 hypothetical protein AWE51_07535 [Aquimarina aggregata]